VQQTDASQPDPSRTIEPQSQQMPHLLARPLPPLARMPAGLRVKWIVGGSVIVAFAILGLGHWLFFGRSMANFTTIISASDRIVVLDGGCECFAPDEEEIVLFEVTDRSEIAALIAHIEFSKTRSPCNCCGFPAIAWYREDSCLARTCVKHGQAFYWVGFGEDMRLTEESQNYLVQWLVKRHVDPQEIEIGCSGPRRVLRVEAAAMRFALECMNDAQSHLATGDMDAAVLDCTRAIGRKSDFGPAYLTRAVIQESKGLLDLALKDLNNAIYFGSESHRKRHAELIHSLSSAVPQAVIEVNLVDAYRVRARVYERKGETAKAQNDLQAAKIHGRVESSPTTPRIQP